MRNTPRTDRSEIMRRVKGKNTKPEMIVRRLAHAMGLRFRLHRKDLPGTPDLVFGPKRKAVFVHGCFWHRHPGCGRATTPHTNLDFWSAKFARNVERDRRVEEALAEAGWDTMVVWECETRDQVALQLRLESFLQPSARVKPLQPKID